MIIVDSGLLFGATPIYMYTTMQLKGDGPQSKQETAPAHSWLPSRAWLVSRVVELHATDSAAVFPIRGIAGDIFVSKLISFFVLGSFISRYFRFYI